MEQEKINKKNEDTNRLRKFENHFFQLLNLLKNIISHLTIRLKERDKPDSIITNREVFEKLYNNYLFFELNYANVSQSDKELYNQHNIERYIDNRYYEFNKKNQDKTGHYFRILYNIIKLIKENE